ncbi:hypothetical protein JL720_15838 [Aureococcus anophagefferens]|nr:hypothetical protein JL720_15838 [Aureococcus anophagefferens]
MLSGYLQKRGKLRQNWKRRYFALKGHTLSCYADARPGRGGAIKLRAASAADRGAWVSAIARGRPPAAADGHAGQVPRRRAAAADDDDAGQVPRRRRHGVEALAAVVRDHDADDDDELTVSAGDVVSVKLARGAWAYCEENDGWVLVQRRGPGPVPFDCLKPGVETSADLGRGGVGRGGDTAPDRDLSARAAAKGVAGADLFDTVDSRRLRISAPSSAASSR